MSKNIFIAKPLSPADGLEKMVIPLGPNPWHGFYEETVWVKKVEDDLYQLQNTPFFAKGLAYKDLVSGHCEDGRLFLDAVKMPSRRSTYRVLVQASASQAATNMALNQLTVLGVTYENYADTHWTLLALDVPAHAVDAAYKILDEGEKNGLWDFEEGHYGGREH